MAERVRELTAAQRGGMRLGSRNGTGFAIAGLSRADADGNCFATRWFTLAGIGVVPLGRFYLREGETSTLQNRSVGGTRQTVTTTQYVFLGATDLKAWEIVRHYVWWILTIPLAVLPSWWLIEVMDNSSRPGGIPVFLLWLAGVIFLPFIMMGVFATLLQVYRNRWAPLYQVEWTGRRHT